VIIVSVMILVAALAFLVLMAYRGHSVILFAPLAALLAVMMTEPLAVIPTYTGLFMTRLSQFIASYFPVFLLGALFGELFKVTGFAGSIAATIIKCLGIRFAMLSIVIVAAILTYCGISLFVAVFAVYPLAAALFREHDIPKRLIPGTIALGAFTFTMDSFPGTPQIQNIIPTQYFHTATTAAPVLGLAGGTFILIAGTAFLDWRRRAAHRRGEGYGQHTKNEPVSTVTAAAAPLWRAVLALLTVPLLNLLLLHGIKEFYGNSYALALPLLPEPIRIDIPKVYATWSVEIALIAAILLTVGLGYRRLQKEFIPSSKLAVEGSLLAAMNTASEFGFGAVIASLAGFGVVIALLQHVGNPLVNTAVTITILAGLTGSASGGLTIALGALAPTFLANAMLVHIPPEVVHRVASMASGGLDTLPHNGAVITLLAVCGLTHKEAYGEIFAVTGIKTLAVLLVIGLHLAFGLV
jgi:H+/gluconate symporter-like permease